MKLAFLFPGQGAQYTGMGKSFYDNYEIAKEIFEKSNEKLGFDLKEKIFTGSEEDLKNTEITQPGILMVSHIASEILKNEGIYPDAVAGLSLGEYSALTEADSIDYYEALNLVSERGKLMEQAVPKGMGSMCAIIGLETEKIESVLKLLSKEGIIKIANYNCPGQIVISGESQLVKKASNILKEEGAKKCIMLSVSGPFHTEFMNQAGVSLGKLLEKVKIKSPNIDFYLNVTGKKYSEENIKENLIKQISSSVLFENIIKNMISDGIDTFIEVGVGRTLSSFAKKTSKSIGKKVSIFNVEDKDSLEKTIAKLK